MMLLGEGNWLESRGILEGLMQAPEPCELCPKVYFYVGLLDLLQMEDPSQMEAGRDYMRAYPQKYPQGPFLRNAERIAQILEGQIQSRRKEQQRLKTLSQKVQGLKALSQKVQEQSKEIDTLKFQIQKLEEITRETEETRENIGTKGQEGSSMPDVKGMQ
jgi:vacuolar-type H+-ATPase subunit I/STV1